ncbi:alpha-keto acid decarboxylase family protein [Paraburkholderia sp. J12]|uniref:alpha-keto acid decarboxylase family protein n=1 Tax=Paraburkholderia sp. J12 TaxID=2805432 RepID=UPI002ABD9AAD|nr:thiamine pyrophosphate-binding protein [Paraburkholderia sp. J12]
MSPIYTVVDYLLDRLSWLGADRIFGVPGDFTLAMLDHIERNPRIEWVGCANELGAGYAADGYARVRGIGALCTTFGVGELSAINAIAGSYAEHVPVVHIVGAPSGAAQAAHARTHHSLGTGDFGVFARMTQEVVCAHATLDANNACAEIDRVLHSVLAHRRPGYLLLPADLTEVQASRPAGPLAGAARMTDARALSRFADAAGGLLDKASTAALLADVLVHRLGAEDRLHALIDAGNIPHATLLWGRRVVNEAHPAYVGIYNGAASAPSVREAIEESDVLIQAGVRFTDLTSGFFTQHLRVERLIDVGPHSSSVAGEAYGPIELADALDVLRTICARRGPFAAREARHVPACAAPEAAGHDPLSQETLWSVVSESLRPGDLVIAEQGTSFYGLGAHRFPENVLFIGQPLWASIGYTLPALLGAALAAPQRRPVLVIGDGSAQLTIAELGTLIRQHVNALVLVINNGGYTVERAIHGPEAAYNDIAHWDWTALPGALGKGRDSFSARVSTVGQLRNALRDADRLPDRLTLIEAVVPQLDVPPLLRELARAAGVANQVAARQGR